MKRTSLLWLIFVLALPLNFIWEMAQMYAYAGMPQRHFNGILICGMAAAGDAVYTALVYWIGKKSTRDAGWISQVTWRRALAILVSGFFAAAVAERVGLTAGLWEYNRFMVRIPAVGVGLWPALQLMLLPFVVFWLAIRFTNSSN